MQVLENLTERHQTFVDERFSPELKIVPTLKTMIIGCVDPRVDPIEILGLSQGDAAVIRNVGGRVNPTTIETMAMLRLVAKSAGGDLGPGWTLIVLHHTDCGITRLTNAPELLATYFGVAPSGLDAKAVTDPYKAVAIDVAALVSAPELSGALLVTGLVYDVHTGGLETVVPPIFLRPGNPT